MEARVRDCLRQLADPAPGGQGAEPSYGAPTDLSQLAVAELHGSSNHREERALSPAVAADQANPAARFYGEGRAVEERQDPVD